MNRIQFNTNRRYTANGQRIVARWENGVCYFRDHDRMIGGEFELKADFVEDLFNRAYVMERYDAGAYHISIRALSSDMAWQD